MCNTLHKEGFCIIPARGQGYKIFCENGSNVDIGIQTMFNHPFSRIISRTIYDESDDGWVHWNPYHRGGDGFCFFSTLTEAIRCLCSLLPFRNGLVRRIRKIEYDGGLGKCDEYKVCLWDVFHISICKAFRKGPLVNYSDIKMLNIDESFIKKMSKV